MIFSHEDEYQDRKGSGALVHALATWQTLIAGRIDGRPQRLEFGLDCTSESRARRVAAYLRRNRALTVTRIAQTDATARAVWRVEGVTRGQVQTLSNLEHLFTCLRRSAEAHQVRLLPLRIA